MRNNTIYSLCAAAAFLMCVGFVVTVNGQRVGEEHNASTALRDLRCQFLSNPVGIDQKKPVFSWKIVGAENNLKQTSYQIIVATSIEDLSIDRALWHSGIVLSDQNSGMPYNGSSLRSATQYYWKVRAGINGNEMTDWSEPQTFITGLLNQQDWNDTHWIAYEQLPDSLKLYPGVHGKGDNLGSVAQKRAVIPYFRRPFYFDKKVKQALVFVSGIGQYELYLNNKRVDKGLMNPTWSNYRKSCYYNTFDVTSLLDETHNVIGAIVGTGFWYINRENYRKMVIAGGYPMLRLKLNILFEDGTTQTIVSDDTWNTTASPTIYSSVYGGEFFDSRREIPGWSKGKIRDEDWRKSIIVNGPGGVMRSQETYPLVVSDSLLPLTENKVDSKREIIDFGQNISGIIGFSMKAPEGYKVRVTPSELLMDNFRPDQRGSGAPYFWEYTFKGSDDFEQWEPKFSYYGFRYAQLEFFDNEGLPVDIKEEYVRYIKAYHIRNGSPQTGTFSNSFSLFNKTFDLIKWGIKNNFSNVLTDCPHREKLGWLEQTHLMGNSIQYNYDILNYYKKIIQDMKDSQLDDGLIPDISPEYVVFEDGFRDSPEWGSAGVLVPWYLYKWYGDTSVLKSSYDLMKRYVDYLNNKSDGKLLDYGLGDWYDIGPLPVGPSQNTPLGLTASSLFYYDTKILHEVADLLGKSDEGIRYRLLADSIKQAFNQKYFDKKDKVYATGSQTSFALPLYVGLVPPEYKEQVVQNLVDSVKSNNYGLTAGDVGYRYLVQVLSDNGFDEVVYRMNDRYDVPGYGYQIAKGATALTETWTAQANRSNDHLMLGHLMEWFYAGLGGIRQEEFSTGYKNILIEPKFVRGVDSVNCSYNSINGIIAVKWQRTDKSHIILNIEIPANTNARLRFQNVDESVGSGKYTYRLKL